MILLVSSLSAPGSGVADVMDDGLKIVQRISPPRLSKLVKECRMADADAELVLQTQNGSPAAFESLVHNHQRMIHSLT